MKGEIKYLFILKERVNYDVFTLDNKLTEDVTLYSVGYDPAGPPPFLGSNCFPAIPPHLAPADENNFIFHTTLRDLMLQIMNFLNYA